MDGGGFYQTRMIYWRITEDSDNGQAVENEDEYIVNHSEGWHGCVIVNTDDSSSAEDKFAKE